MATSLVNFGAEEVRYVSGYNCEPLVADEVADSIGAANALLIADERLAFIQSRLLALLRERNVDVTVLPVAATESTKSLATVDSLVRHALKIGAHRGTSVLALGGGVVGNIAGMVAGLLFRGVPLIHLPTTPVAAFDAAISRKQAVNAGGVKNVAGLFKTPALIALDLKWIETVPGSMMRTGLLEMAKNVIAVRPEYQAAFLQAVAALDGDPRDALTTFRDIGVGAKAPFLAQDENETSGALVFEYGHTIGHAIESASSGSVTHGAAVGWGMLAAADIAREVAGLSVSEHRSHETLLGHLGIARRQPPEIDPAAVKRLVRSDTKRGYMTLASDQLPMVLLSAFGDPVYRQNKPLLGVELALVDLTIDRLLTPDGPRT